MKVFIQKEFFPEIYYSWEMFAKNKSIPYNIIDEATDVDLKISADADSDLYISNKFFDLLKKRQFNHENVLSKDMLLKDDSYRIDYLSLIFYMINSLQEIGSSERDKLGRFLFKKSYQYKFNCATDNIVQSHFDRICTEVSQLKAFKTNSIKTRIFLSHDIDTVNGALLQDSFFALKKGRIDWFMTLLFRNLFFKPDWLNIDKIMKIESEYDFKSTFFWLVNQGKVSKRLYNSDYDIKSKKIIDVVLAVEKNKWNNGLHKSISDESFQDELKKLYINTNANRYHYLKFSPYEDYPKIENSGLKLDSSLGFFDYIGFRNSYGLPFQPFNINERRKYNFAECPLHVMDGTYRTYLKRPASEMVKEVKTFFEKNSRNCVISVLFHNNYFSEYKFGEYLKAIKELLSYFYEMQFETISPKQIIKEYLNEN